MIAVLLKIHYTCILLFHNSISFPLVWSDLKLGQHWHIFEAIENLLFRLPVGNLLPKGICFCFRESIKKPGKTACRLNVHANTLSQVEMNHIFYAAKNDLLMTHSGNANGVPVEVYFDMEGETIDSKTCKCIYRVKPLLRDLPFSTHTLLY